MQLTLFSDYSLRVLLYLSTHHGRRVPLPEISAAYGVSQHHLVKVVQRLVEERLVESVRGRGGGLRLARPPGDINIAAVVRLTEPNSTLVECFDARTNTCPIDSACGLKMALVKAQNAFFAELERYSLADFSSRGPALIKLWRPNLKDAAT
jgi:Rrf2 family transcriptional regulator, nitric oxide-sensitive transcriptional repressor